MPTVPVSNDPRLDNMGPEEPKDRSVAKPMMEAAINATKEREVEYPSDDNWRHRSAQMKCQTCMWYVAKRAALGRCRRRSPTMSGFPAVFESDWCGDHKLNEEDVG